MTIQCQNYPRHTNECSNIGQKISYLFPFLFNCSFALHIVPMYVRKSMYNEVSVFNHHETGSRIRCSPLVFYCCFRNLKDGCGASQGCTLHNWFARHVWGSIEPAQQDLRGMAWNQTRTNLLLLVWYIERQRRDEGNVHHNLAFTVCNKICTFNLNFYHQQ